MIPATSARTIDRSQTMVKQLARSTNSPEQPAFVSVDPDEMPQAFTITFDNSAVGVPTVYVLGDPLGAVAAKAGITAKAADAAPILPAALNASFGATPMVIGRINYKVKNSSIQFDEPLELISVNQAGKLKREQVNIAEAIRNNQYNDKLQTLDVNVTLSQFRGMFLTVGANEVVSLTCTPVLAARG